MITSRSQSAREMYSGLYFLLKEQEVTVADLARRVASLGEAVDSRTLNRLADPDRPLKHIDARILDTVCRALRIDVGQLLIFAPALGADLHQLPKEQQHRLNILMDAHSEGTLSPDELRELETLVAKVDDLDFDNTRRLVEHRERIGERVRSRSHSAAD